MLFYIFLQDIFSNKYFLMPFGWCLFSFVGIWVAQGQDIKRRRKKTAEKSARVDRYCWEIRMFNCSTCYRYVPVCHNLVCIVTLIFFGHLNKSKITFQDNYWQKNAIPIHFLLFVAEFSEHIQKFKK